MLKKLSLAALIAMGSMSVATATPLTEAIKNVDISGFLRVRFYNEDFDKSKDYNRWRTNAVVITKIPASENIKFVVRNSVESNVYTNHTSITNPDKTSVDSGIVNNLLFMAYSNGPVNAIVGKIPVATSVTSADPAAPGHGAGAIATYKVNDNLTVGAAFIDALKNPGENIDRDLNGDGEDDVDLAVVAQDIYAAVAVFNADMINGQIWAYKVDNLVDYLVTASVNVKPVENLTIHADYAVGELDSDVADVDAKNYYNVSLAYKQDALCAKIGYAYTDKHLSVVEFSGDAPIGAVITTANNYNIANLQDTSSIYGKVGYNIDAKTNVYVAAQYQDAGSDSANENNDLMEYTIGGKYKVNKKLAFSAYYDIQDWDSKASNEDQNEFRFEAKYSF